MQASTSPSKKKKKESLRYSQLAFPSAITSLLERKKKSLKEGGKKKADSSFLSKQLFLTESEKGKEGVMIE